MKCTMKRTVLTIALLMLTLLAGAQQLVTDTLGFGIEAEASYARSENTDKTGRLGFAYRHQTFDIYGALAFEQPNNVQEGQVVHMVKADSLWRHSYDMRHEEGGKGYQGQIGLNLRLKPEHTFGLIYTMDHVPSADDGGALIGSISMDGLHSLYTEKDWTFYSGNMTGHLLNAFYRGQVRQTSIEVDAEYYFDKVNQNIIIEEKEGDEKAETGNSIRQERNRMYALTLDIGHQLAHGMLNWGATYIHSLRDDHYQQSFLHSLEENTFNRHRFIPYLSHTLETDQWQFITSMRYDAERHDAHWLPAIALKRTEADTEIELAYQTTALRPSYGLLSNYASYQDRYDRELGNPELQTEYMHHLSFRGNWKWVEGRIGYEDMRHAVVQVAHQSTWEPYLTYWTYDNLPSLKSVYAALSLAPEIGRWSPTLNVELRKQWLRLHTGYGDIDMNHPVLRASFNNEIDLGHGWMAEAVVNYRSKGDERNVAYTKCSLTADLSIGKWFLGNKLHVKIEGNDLLHGRREATRLYDQHTMLQQDLKFDSRQVMVTLRYSFNMSHPTYDGHEAGQVERERF